MDPPVVYEFLKVVTLHGHNAGSLGLSIMTMRQWSTYKEDGLSTPPEIFYNGMSHYTLGADHS